MGERLQIMMRLKRSGLFSKWRKIFETICLFVEPISRNTLICSCTSSKCIRSLNCSSDSCGCFSLKFNYIFIYILIHIICIFHGNISEFLYTYQSGWFFAIFNDFSSSSFNVFICEKVGFTLSCAVASVPFGIPFSIRCKVFLWRITSCPHFVIFTSSKILLHECKTHCWREKKNHRKCQAPIIYQYVIQIYYL